MIFAFISYILSKGIVITSHDDFNRHLSIINGGKIVRMLSTSSKLIENGNDEFTIRHGLTKISQDNLNICGKLFDSGVVPCVDQNERIRFRFKDIGENNVNIVSDDGLCLTRKSIDKKTDGNYLNLSKCADTENQKFKVFIIVTTRDANMDMTYELANI
ncbi:hypothetical protein P3W45_000930 [Vairimorpha bombi]|jgi:hypothetical protein